ncbi:hypothetical protein ElyMa_006688600 [Elysia marginata]|uniref:Uncharacterized protein n=1 Tax=Elysia marginata TaxID=1093978 RepID=A0AAV4IQT2_9GAST|nr:hypothetical protein ElyMa_006688600 [Elysia marginata]
MRWICHVTRMHDDRLLKDILKTSTPQQDVCKMARIAPAGLGIQALYRSSWQVTARSAIKTLGQKRTEKWGDSSLQIDNDFVPIRGDNSLQTDNDFAPIRGDNSLQTDNDFAPIKDDNSLQIDNDVGPIKGDNSLLIDNDVAMIEKLQ